MSKQSSRMSQPAFLLLIVLLAACRPADTPQDAGATPAATAPAASTPPAALPSALPESTATSMVPPAAQSELTGTSWQLVKIQSMDDRTFTPKDGSKYTITFGADGRAAIQIDCNRGSGTWTSAGNGQLTFGPVAMTKMMCPPGSLYDRVSRDLEHMRSYVLKDGHLFISLMADGGIYEFAPRQ